MKDIFKQGLEIGDKVAFNPPRYKGLLTGHVLYFSPQKVRIEYYWQGSPEQTSVYPGDLVKKPN